MGLASCTNMKRKNINVTTVDKLNAAQHNEYLLEVEIFGLFAL